MSLNDFSIYSILQLFRQLFEKDLFLMAGNIVTVLEECASESKVKISLISELKNVTIFHSDVINL